MAGGTWRKSRRVGIFKENLAGPEKIFQAKPTIIIINDSPLIQAICKEED